MKTELSETELRAWQALLHAHHQVTRKLDAELREEHGLPLGAYDVLLRLARAPEQRLRMTELAEKVLLSPSGLTRVVDRLVADGLVRRGPLPGAARGSTAPPPPPGTPRLGPGPPADPPG